jgi:hypothetical protein
MTVLHASDWASVSAIFPCDNGRYDDGFMEVDYQFWYRTSGLCFGGRMPYRGSAEGNGEFFGAAYL